MWAKFVFFIFIFFIAVILITRFLAVENFSAQGSKPKIECSQENQPQFDDEGFEIIQILPSCQILERINRDYLSTVKPILSQKCLSCHGMTNTLPLYSQIPPVSWLVAHDLKEAKEHMDMTFDFPFQGHGGVDEDLEAIAKVVKKDTMPPLRYKIMHWQSYLTREEKTILLKWVQESRRLLNQGEKKP